MAKIIHSASNPIIKELIKIKTDVKFRNEGGVVLIEGEKLIRDVSSVLPLHCVLGVDERWTEMFPAKEAFLTTEEVFRKIASTETPEGVLAVVEMPKYALPNSLKKLLVLDRIQDPGNVGALIRTAYALSWDGVFLLQGTADAFNDKALRAAKGATFRIPLMKGDFLSLKKTIDDLGLSLLAADMGGVPIKKAHIEGPVALALGNEGQGLSNELLNDAKAVSIPMRKEAESLNVAVSGAILMYELS